MNETKHKLIARLNEAIKPLKDLPELILKENIYLEDGFHVDLEFMTAVLSFMSESTTVSENVMRALQKLLGIEDASEKSQKEDQGANWDAPEILRHCVLEDNILKLPKVKFSKKSYGVAKAWIEEAGGSWEGGRVQGFTFPFDATRVFSILSKGERCRLQKEFQFFETPAEVADWLVSLVGDIKPGDRILEPSAGRGAIVKAIKRVCPEATVDCYELMPENIGILAKVSGVVLVGDDFEKDEEVEFYSKIIANPPFNKNQDVRHVMKMYDHLLPGGCLASITSKHWQVGQESECVRFREWLEAKGAVIHDIAEGEFKESGTGIATAAIVIIKD